MRDLTRFLSEWLADGGRRIGQVAITPIATGWELRHVDNLGRTDLPVKTSAEDARHLANLDDTGAFRPLKTAPNLPHGWCLQLPDVATVRVALEYFYPAMVGVAFSHRLGKLAPVSLRVTLGRQTGMYRVTQKITDEQARAMVDGFCAGCLKHRLWELEEPNATPAPAVAKAFPLLCQEACNLLVAEARKVVKSTAT